MVRVLVLGATGYIGNAVARALRRSSHIVYGLARDETKGQNLAKQEILPVIGSVEGGEYLDVVESAHVDVVIDASGVYGGSRNILNALKKVGASRLGARGGVSPKLGFLYTSGIWVHGNSTSIRLNDLNELGANAPLPPADLVSWRPELETEMLAARDVLDIAIIRPGLVYGLGMNTFGPWFGPIAKASQEGSKSVEIQADANALLAMIHVEELAQAYVKVASQISRFNGAHPVFDVVASTENLGGILHAAAKTLGFHGELNLVKPTDPFMIAMSTGVRLDSTRLRDLTGWENKRLFGVLEEVEILTTAWLAANNR